MDVSSPTPAPAQKEGAEGKQASNRGILGDACNHAPILETFGKILDRLDEVSADHRKIEQRVNILEAKVGAEITNFRAVDDAARLRAQAATLEEKARQEREDDDK